LARGRAIGRQRYKRSRGQKIWGWIKFFALVIFVAGLVLAIGFVGFAQRVDALKPPNARETAAWAEALGYEHILLVTSSYHMPRAQNEINAAKGRIRITPYPVSRSEDNHWYSDKARMKRLLNEYAKLFDTPSHLSPSKDQLSRITDNAPIMLAEIDASLHYTFVNAPYAAMFGKTAQDIIGLSVDSLLGQEAFEKTRVNTQKVLNGEPVRYDLRLPRVDAQGNDFIKVMDVSYSPHFDETGTVVSYIATIVDKTAESLALKKVDDLNIKLRTALDLSLNGFVVIRSVRSDAGEIIDFDYVYANPKAEEIGGTSLVGHRLLELFPGNKEMGLYDAYVDVVETRNRAIYGVSNSQPRRDDQRI